MSNLKLHPFEFEGKPIHTLTVGGRPAWIARELGAVLGYTNGGKRLASKLTRDWSEDFVAGKDFAMLVGDELAAVKAQGRLVSPSARGLLVLFESGLHMALVKTHMPLGRRLRRFLVDEVLPQLARTGACDPDGRCVDPSPDLGFLARVLRVDLADRRFRSRTLRHTADALVDLGRIDEGAWRTCLVSACEIALGQPLPVLYGAIDHDWLDGAALARRLGVPLPRVFAAAHALNLFERASYVRPVPVFEGSDWTLIFRFSPEAVALLEAWFAEQDDTPVPAEAPAA